MARKLGLIGVAISLLIVLARHVAVAPTPARPAAFAPSRPAVPASAQAKATAVVAGKQGAASAKASSAAQPVASGRMAVAQERWAALAQGVRELDSADQAGLDKLYARAREAILADEAASAQALAQAMPALTQASLEESFFAISAWIRYSHAPTQVIEALWQAAPPTNPGDRPDPHHEGMTPAVRYERMQAYSFRELRTQLEQGRVQLGSEEERRFVAALVPRATQERSLDVSLEMFQLLADLKEPQAIQSALGGHTIRDQQLILGVIAANP